MRAFKLFITTNNFSKHMISLLLLLTGAIYQLQQMAIISTDCSQRHNSHYSISMNMPLDSCEWRCPRAEEEVSALLLDMAGLMWAQNWPLQEDGFKETTATASVLQETRTAHSSIYQIPAEKTVTIWSILNTNCLWSVDCFMRKDWKCQSHLFLHSYTEFFTVGKITSLLFQIIM